MKKIILKTYIIIIIIFLSCTHFCSNNDDVNNANLPYSKDETKENLDDASNSSNKTIDSETDSEILNENNIIIKDKETKSDKEINNIKNPKDYLIIEYDSKKIYLKKLGDIYTKETPITELPKDNYYIIYFDKKGRRVKEETILNNKAAYTQIKMYYDTGEILLKADFDKDLNPISVYHYNKESRNIKRENYIIGKIKFIVYYNDTGKKIREENYSNGIISNAFNYKKEVIVKEERYNSDGKPNGWWIYRNDNANKIKEEYYKNDNLTEYIIYNYDSLNNKTKEAIYKEGALRTYFLYSYTDEYIIQERYEYDETNQDGNVFILMDRVQYKR